jgi:hypothetical protein
MAARTTKATFNIRIDVLAALDEAVSHGAAPSKNALVERALVKEIDRLRRQARAQAWEEASRDPAFLRDLGDLEAVSTRVVPAPA